MPEDGVPRTRSYTGNPQSTKVNLVAVFGGGRHACIMSAAAPLVLFAKSCFAGGAKLVRLDTARKHVESLPSFGLHPLKGCRLWIGRKPVRQGNSRETSLETSMPSPPTATAPNRSSSQNSRPHPKAELAPTSPGCLWPKPVQDDRTRAHTSRQNSRPRLPRR